MPICRICGSAKDDQYVRAPVVFGGTNNHKFWQCKRCNAIYLHPVPSVEEERRFYAEEFEKFMSSRVGDHRDWSNAEKHKLTNQDQVKRRLPFLETALERGKTLLEIGCSSGFMLDAFKEYGLACSGVEPSGEFGDYLRQSGYEVWEDLKHVGNRRFDVIVNFFVLEHIRNPRRFLARIHELLSNGGVCICEVPCANDVLTSLYHIDAFEQFYWSVAHHFYYTPESLQYVMKGLGYRYKLVPEQRYDLSNHMTWMMDGRPGGQGRYLKELGQDVMQAYRQRLLDSWRCDSMFLYFWKTE